LIGKVLRRAVTLVFGFLLATGVGAIFLPLAAILDPAVREIGAGAVFALARNAGRGIDPALGFIALADWLWAAVIAVCVAPLAFVAVVGEAAGQRGWLWHAAGCGFLAAAAPWIARAAHGSPRAQDATPLELRIAALFFLTGVLTGTVYWLIAGRRARRG
jgi:hypothetical protein